MTLFITTPKRRLIINEVYIVILAFLLSFAVGRILKAVTEELNKKNQSIANPRGGDLDLQLYDDSELTDIILACIADNERYLVKDNRMIKLVFDLVKAKIKNPNLILTPNMLRFLALQFIPKEKNLVV